MEVPLGTAVSVGAEGGPERGEGKHCGPTAHKTSGHYPDTRSWNACLSKPD